MIHEELSGQSGFTLLEVVVAMSLFVFTILGATAIFQAVVNSQRNAIAAQNIQESMRYAFEVISKEVRMAQLNTGGCGSAVNSIYNKMTVNGDDALYFKNKNGDCVVYYLQDGALMVQRGGFIASTTPSRVRITNLSFYIEDNPAGSSVFLQPVVVVNVAAETADAKAQDKQKMIVRTAISSRKYH